MACFQKNDREKESFIGEYRVARGLSVNELCKMADIGQPQYYGLLYGIDSPLYEDKMKTGMVKPEVRRILAALNITVGDAFPRYVCKIENLEDKELTDGQVLGLTHSRTVEYREPDDSFVAQMLLQCLRDDELAVIRHKFWNNYSIDRVALKLKLSRADVHRIEVGAMSKMKNKARNMPEYRR